MPINIVIEALLCGILSFYIDNQLLCLLLYLIIIAECTRRIFMTWKSKPSIEQSWWTFNTPSPNIQFGALLTRSQRNIPKTDHAHGSNCKKAHKYVDFTPLCKFWKRKNDKPHLLQLFDQGCLHGNKCKNRHFLSKDEKLNDTLNRLAQVWSKNKPKSIVSSTCDMQSKSVSKLNVPMMEIKCFDGQITLFKSNETEMLFHLKKHLHHIDQFFNNSWQINVIMEGRITLTNEMGQSALKLVTNQIFIHEEQSWEGDTFGGNIDDYVIRQYWIQSFKDTFHCVCSNISENIIYEILTYSGFPFWVQHNLSNRIIFLIMDCFCFKAQIEGYKIDNLWNVSNKQLLLSVFDNDFRMVFELMTKTVFPFLK